MWRRTRPAARSTTSLGKRSQKRLARAISAPTSACPRKRKRPTSGSKRRVRGLPTSWKRAARRAPRGLGPEPEEVEDRAQGVVPGGKVVHPALMEAHEEGELGEVDPKEPHPLQKAQAEGRPRGEEEPEQAPP